MHIFCPDRVLDRLPADASVEDIERAVEDAGLFPYLPEHLAEFPARLHPRCGRGLGLWQYPCQFARYLDFVRQFPVRTYVEVGVAAGGTFMFTHEFLRKRAPLHSYAVDIAPPGGVCYLGGAGPFAGQLDAFLAAGSDREFFRGTSADFARARPGLDIDLLLIDGDHSYEGVKADVAALAGRAALVAFHDITNDAVPGVGQFWRELREAHPDSTHEFAQQYDGVRGTYLGIGVWVRRPQPRVAVLVTSCASFCDTTLPVLLPSLRAARVPDGDVFVVVGDCDADAQVAPRQWRVAHVAGDNNGMVWAVGEEGRRALRGYDWVFYMHDTCMALPQFGQCMPETLEHALQMCPSLDALRLGRGYCMGMGYYRVAALEAAAAAIRAMARHDTSAAGRLNVKEGRAVGEVEDSVFRILSRAGRVVASMSFHGPIGDVAPMPVYAGGGLRRTEVWWPGLLKFKANWTPGDFKLDL